ncbi:MAG TPA: glycine oxidase ThiO [Ktedonobacteraceae bacterium]|nr:glycine oxidase ThiO [Ktedonobacteraceae bacterium]
METTTDVVIVGGGVIGCAIAYYLRKLGATVTVLERGEIGAEASSAAAGLLAPLGSLSGPRPYADLMLASWNMFPSLVPELEKTSGVHVEYEQTGVLRIVRNAKNSGSLRKRMQEWKPLGLQMQWLTGDEARQHEPLLAPDVSAAVYAPQEAQTQAPNVVQAFARAAARLGAKLYSQHEVTGLEHINNKVTAVTINKGETIVCDHLVIATGAWSARCGEWLNVTLPISPQKGQILTLRQPERPLRTIIFGEALYVAPKQDNTIVVGATKEEVNFDTQITAGGIAWLLNSAMHLVPVLETCAIEQIWSGLRPKTPDSQPILGRAPNWENVTLAVGHSSTGILLSPITGKCIAELVARGQEDELIKPFGVGRFGG